MIYLHWVLCVCQWDTEPLMNGSYIHCWTCHGGRTNDRDTDSVSVRAFIQSCRVKLVSCCQHSLDHTMYIVFNFLHLAVGSPWQFTTDPHLMHWTFSNDLCCLWVRPQRLVTIVAYYAAAVAIYAGYHVQHLSSPRIQSWWHSSLGREMQIPWQGVYVCASTLHTEDIF
jgi:hypothetical protein